jgi:hypothetical protein
MGSSASIGCSVATGAGSSISGTFVDVLLPDDLLALLALLEGFDGRSSSIGSSTSAGVPVLSGSIGTSSSGTLLPWAFLPLPLVLAFPLPLPLPDFSFGGTACALSAFPLVGPGLLEGPRGEGDGGARLSNRG